MSRVHRHSGSRTLKPVQDLAPALPPGQTSGGEGEWIAFRGKAIDRLPAVWHNGVDVNPTNDTIFCAELDKAFEYARPESGLDGPGLIYALHGGYLERSFRVLPSDASLVEIAEVRRTYPYQYDDPHGRLRFSRLADQVNPAYEDAYGYWVPGNARDALLAIFVIGQMSQVVEALTVLTAPPAVKGSLLTG